MLTRTHLVRGAAFVGTFAFVASVAWALQATGILNADWSNPTKGTYKAPAAEVGKKVTDKKVWSLTTVNASIDKKPVQGKPITAVGEIIDLSCYLQVGKRGDKHRDCGQKCAKNGQPIGLLLADGTVYLLCDEEHDPRRDGMTDFRKNAIEMMAYVVTVHGTATDVGGQKAIFVHGFLKK